MSLALTPLADASGDAALVQAARWVQSLLLGSTATIVTTLAIAALGFLMLQGRLPVRRGLTAVIGCFVIFASATIAGALSELQASISNSRMDVVTVAAPPAPVQAPPQPTVYDPYAGAAVPTR